jgi:hypothetical protein
LKPVELANANVRLVFERVPVNPLSVSLVQQLVLTGNLNFRATTTLFVPQGCFEENEMEGLSHTAAFPTRSPGGPLHRRSAEQIAGVGTHF